MRIAAGVFDRVELHARGVHPHEACGVLTATVGALDVVDGFAAMRNVAEEPWNHYALDADEQLLTWDTILNAGRYPRVAYHSHPRGGAEMSHDDVRLAPPNPNLLHLVYSVEDSAARLWRVEAAGGRVVRVHEVPFMLVDVPLAAQTEIEKRALDT